MSFSYIGSPYSHHDPAVVYDRFRRVEKFTADMLKNGHFVYSPIVHCHELAREHKLPTDFNFWMDYNLAMLQVAKELIVCMLPGWEESKGLQAEIEAAGRHEISIRYIEP